jgi:predicted amidophosphoribosyltransferase
VPLKALIFGLEGVLIKDVAGLPDTGLVSARKDQIRAELRQVFEFLRSKGVRPIVLSNRNWKFSGAGKSLTLDEALSQMYGPLKLYVTTRGDLPAFKPRRESIEALLRLEQLQAHEVAMVGMSQKDFRTAANSNLLFLNATWDRRETQYGFVFESPAEIIRFVELFALKEHPWFYQIDEPVCYRSLGPYSTWYEEWREYSEAAERALKRVTEDRHFFLNTVVASLYFTGLIQKVDKIACIPGHEAGYGNPAMNDSLTLVGKIFRKNYVPDLIVRHGSARSQRMERRARREPTPEAQFTSIHLTKFPLKSGEQRYLTPIKLRDKTILIFDDFTTHGYSFEAARYFLKQAGAEVVLVSCLKTIRRGYRVIQLARQFDPYRPLTLSPGELRWRELSYDQYVVDPDAPMELSEDFERFKNWQEP